VRQWDPEEHDACDLRILFYNLKGGELRPEVNWTIRLTQ
jgi:hypothetical protein